MRSMNTFYSNKTGNTFHLNLILFNIRWSLIMKSNDELSVSVNLHTYWVIFAVRVIFQFWFFFQILMRTNGSGGLVMLMSSCKQPRMVYHQKMIFCLRSKPKLAYHSQRRGRIKPILKSSHARWK